MWIRSWGQGVGCGLDHGDRVWGSGVGHRSRVWESG